MRQRMKRSGLWGQVCFGAYIGTRAARRNPRRSPAGGDMKRFIVIAALCVIGIGTAAQAQPQPAPALRTINVITFGGGFNLPLFVAQRQGFFAKHGVEVNLRYTPNSVYVMTGLIEGRFDITTSRLGN